MSINKEKLYTLITNQSDLVRLEEPIGKRGKVKLNFFVSIELVIYL